MTEKSDLIHSTTPKAHVRVVMLNRAPKRNALSNDLIAELAATCGVPRPIRMFVASSSAGVKRFSLPGRILARCSSAGLRQSTIPRDVLCGGTSPISPSL